MKMNHQDVIKIIGIAIELLGNDDDINGQHELIEGLTKRRQQLVQRGHFMMFDETKIAELLVEGIKSSQMFS